MNERPEIPISERRSGRGHRAAEALRLLPYVGAIGVFFPLLWVGQGEDTRSSFGGIYIFVLWALLIVAAAIFARVLRQAGSIEREDKSDETN